MILLFHMCFSKIFPKPSQRCIQCSEHAYPVHITIVHGAYKPTYNWAPSCKGLPIHSLNVDNIPPESSPGAKWLSGNGRIPGSDSFQERRKGGAKLRPHIYHISSCIYIYIYILDPYISHRNSCRDFLVRFTHMKKKGRGIRVFQTLHGNSPGKIRGKRQGSWGNLPMMFIVVRSVGYLYI